MRQYIIIVLGLMMVFMVGCSNIEPEPANLDNTTSPHLTSTSIPSDISEQFYNDMLVANDLIKKSIATGYFYLGEYDEDTMMKYYFMINKHEVNKEIKNYYMEKGIDISGELTTKEQYIFNLLFEIDFDLFGYYAESADTRYKDHNEIAYIEKLLNTIKDKHKQFETLLGIQEPT